MTAPPGGPYGQDPYGANPYGQQGPYWGGQPSQPGQPQGGSYPPPGGGYPYQPPGGPYNTGGYAPQQFPQGGQQYPPGGPPGSYPPGSYPPGPPPPGGPSSKLPWLIIAGLAVLGVVALVATLIVTLGGDDNKSPSAAPSTSTSTSGAPTSTGKASAQTAKDCTPNVSGGDTPKGDAIIAGKLSFPASAAPGWSPFSDDQDPNLIGAVGVSQDVPGGSQWMMSAEVAITNFVSSMDITAQASKLAQCVANGPGYANATPTLGPLKTSSTTVDGIKAARVDADVSIADPARGVKGDSIVIIAVDTKPVTVFMGSTPIGDAASAGLINKIVGTLKVAK